MRCDPAGSNREDHSPGPQPEDKQALTRDLDDPVLEELAQQLMDDAHHLSGLYPARQRSAEGEYVTARAGDCRPDPESTVPPRKQRVRSAARRMHVKAALFTGGISMLLLVASATGLLPQLGWFTPEPVPVAETIATPKSIRNSSTDHQKNVRSELGVARQPVLDQVEDLSEQVAQLEEKISAEDEDAIRLIRIAEDLEASMVRLQTQSDTWNQRESKRTDLMANFSWFAGRAVGQVHDQTTHSLAGSSVRLDTPLSVEYVAPIEPRVSIDAGLHGVWPKDHGLVYRGYGWAWGTMRSNADVPVDATVTPAAFQQSLFFYATDPEMEGLLDLMAPTPTKKVTISF